MEVEQMTAVARERADQRIDAALGDLHKAAAEIGKKHGIPEGIQGHSIAELLGRMAWIPSMARDLRMACGQEMAKGELNKLFDEKPTPAAVTDFKDSPTIAPSKIPGNIPVGMDVGDLQGVTVQTVKALREGGLNKVGDLLNIPDAHLVKMQGLGDKSVAQVRAAIARASAGAQGSVTS